jgi:hypothetical protein
MASIISQKLLGLFESVLAPCNTCLQWKTAMGTRAICSNGIRYCSCTTGTGQEERQNSKLVTYILT